MRPQIPPPKAAALTFCFPVLLEKRQIVSIFTCSSALTANILVVGRWISPGYVVHSTGGQPHTNINTNTNKKTIQIQVGSLADFDTGLQFKFATVRTNAGVEYTGQIIGVGINFHFNDHCIEDCEDHIDDCEDCIKSSCIWSPSA